MRTDDFDYELPEELIAQDPPEHRGDSRMMVLDPLSGECSIHPFRDFAEFLSPGDALVRNNTRVIRARLFARKETGAKIEIFLLGLHSPDNDRLWRCMMRPAKRVSPGAELCLFERDGETLSVFSVRLLGKDSSGVCTVEFLTGEVDAALRQCGHLPLPPYIRRPDEELDSERYQTLYARTPGAVAAPTAGLHFTGDVFRELERKNVKIIDLTLHVGAGTFKPVTEEYVEEHQMHREFYCFPGPAASLLNETRASGRRILAVGTTSLRTLETCVDPSGVFHPGEGETDIFIHPPRRVLSADMLLTNFHLPKSTLLMLVSAFAGTENIRRAYALAVQEKMRFFSYGDCMLILNRISENSEIPGDFFRKTSARPIPPEEKNG